MSSASFVELANLFSQIDSDHAVFGNGSDTTTPTLTPLAFYRYPFDPGLSTNANFDGHATALDRGIGEPVADGPRPDGLMITNFTNPNGTLSRISHTRVEDVADGLSSSVFVAEVCMISSDKWVGIWVGANL